MEQQLKKKISDETQEQPLKQTHKLDCIIHCVKEVHIILLDVHM